MCSPEGPESRMRQNMKPFRDSKMKKKCSAVPARKGTLIPYPTPIHLGHRPTKVWIHPDSGCAENGGLEIEEPEKAGPICQMSKFSDYCYFFGPPFTVLHFQSTPGHWLNLLIDVHCTQATRAKIRKNFNIFCSCSRFSFYSASA